MFKGKEAGFLKQLRQLWPGRKLGNGVESKRGQSAEVDGQQAVRSKRKAITGFSCWKSLRESPCWGPGRIKDPVDGTGLLDFVP